MSFTILSWLELGASLAYVASKYLLSRAFRRGWMVGCLAAVAAGMVYFLHGKFILFSEEIGAFLLYGYGYYHWREHADRSHPFQRVVFAAILASSLGILLFSFSSVGLLELMANVVYIIGTGLIVHKLRIGWVFYMVAHLTVAYIMWNSGAYVFSTFQAVSAVIALSALSRKA